MTAKVLKFVPDSRPTFERKLKHQFQQLAPVAQARPQGAARREFRGGAEGLAAGARS